MKSDSGKLLLADEVAKHLRTDRQTVYEWLRSGALPGFKLRGRWRVYEAELEAWLAELRQQGKCPRGK